MGYSDQKYYDRALSFIQDNVTGTFTATASAHAGTVSAISVLPKFRRATVISKPVVTITTAPVSASVVLAIMNGAGTAGSISVGTHTAGETLEGTMTSSLGTFTASSGPTINLISTGTASAAQVGGVYDLYFEDQEVFTSP